VDLELLKTVAGRLGIEIRSGKGQGYDHALAEILLLLEQDAIASGEPPQAIEPAAPVSQTVADQAKTLAWLTGRVEALEAEISQLQQEKQGARCFADTARGATNLSQENEQSQLEINQLHDENNRLKTELLQTQSRMEGIQCFLNEGAIERTKQEKGATAAIEKTTPADAIKTQAASPMPQKAPDAVSQADLDPDVLRALNAILDYNGYDATSHQQRWAISIPVMKDLLKQLGKATQPKIEAVLRAKSEATEQHHRHHGLGQRHNRVHKGRSISEIIKL
jgi:cell division protein FtsB